MRRGAGLALRAGCRKNLLGRATRVCTLGTATLGAAGLSSSIPQILRRHTELSTRLPWTGAGDSSVRPESLCVPSSESPAWRGHCWCSALGVRAAGLPLAPASRTCAASRCYHHSLMLSFTDGSLGSQQLEKGWSAARSDQSAVGNSALSSSAAGSAGRTEPPPPPSAFSD